MLAVVKATPAPGISIIDVPKPTPKPGEVLIKVHYASICGTDIGIYDWIPWVQTYITPPVIIGHEVVGEIVEINGEAPHLQIGDMVSSETHIYDDSCYQCEIGNKHICENMKFFGMARDGGFAEFATIPIRTTWKNNPAVPVKAMSVQEPLGNSVHAVTKANVKGKKLLIIGLGPTGMCAAAAAQAYGASHITGVDPTEYRRQLTESFAYIETLSSLPKDRFNTYDAVIDMSGSPAGIQTAFDAVRIGGILVAFGIPKQKIEVDWGTYLINKELTIHSVYGRRIWETWDQVSELLTSGKIDLTKTITHEFELADFEEAMKVMKSGECGKVLLKVL